MSKDLIAAGNRLLGALKSGGAGHGEQATREWREAVEASGLLEDGQALSDSASPDMPEVPTLREQAEEAPNQEAQVRSLAGAATEQDLADAAVNQQIDPAVIISSEPKDLDELSDANNERVDESDAADDMRSMDANIEAELDGGADGPDATDAAKARADELGVDLSQVEGSGKDGRITVADVEKDEA